MELHERVREFTRQTVAAMGVPLDVAIVDAGDNIREMARFMMEKAKSAGPQEMGPLNPYARRLVHLTVAEDPQMSSESIGDAFLKTVIISVRR